jgi:hypothetical protein
MIFTKGYLIKHQLLSLCQVSYSHIWIVESFTKQRNWKISVIFS